MKLPIKLLGLAGLVGASAATAIAIDRRRRRIATVNATEIPLDRMGLGTDVVIVDAEILGLDPNYR